MPPIQLPPLPRVLDPREPLLDDPVWAYPSHCAGGGGVAHLRVWATDQNGHLAVVTEKGIGVTITNAAEDIHAKLANAHRGPLVVLEHWTAGDGAPYARLDQVHMASSGEPQWRAVWPIPPANPRFAVHHEWMRAFGAILLAARMG
ncbi:hypothetical protein ACWD4N_46200 [Streptomyces sp. NPDC002586]